MKIPLMNLAGVQRRMLFVGLIWMLSVLAFAGFHLPLASADESADSSTNRPPPPARRVRRRYDSVVQMHVPGMPQELPKLERAPSVPKEGEQYSPDPVRMLTAPSTNRNMVPNQVVHIRQPASKTKDQKADSDLWITMPAGTLLGVNLIQSSESAGAVSWGWLADDSRKIRSEEGRKTDAQSEEEVDDTIERQSGDMLVLSAGFLGGAIVAPAPNRGVGPTDDVAKRAAGPSDIPAWAQIRMTTTPEQTRIPEGRARDAWPPISDPTPRMDRADTEPWFSGLGRRVTDIAEAHRPSPVTPAAPDTQDWIVRRLDPAAVPSFESRSAREDAASIAGPPPLLSGSPENYGRRGDIFSPSFQSTSSPLPGPALSRSLGSEATFNPPSVPSAIEPVRSMISEGSGFPNMRDTMRPFDPAGRVWTDMHRPR